MAQLEGDMVVWGVPAGQTLAFRQFRLTGPTAIFDDPVAMRIRDNTGSTVCFEECTLGSGGASTARLTQMAGIGTVDVRRSTCVQLESCLVPSVNFPRIALTCTEAQVAIVRGRYEGGQGLDPTIVTSGTAGAGIWIAGGSVFLDFNGQRETAVQTSRPPVARRQSVLTRSPGGFVRGATSLVTVASAANEPHWLLMSPVLRPRNQPGTGSPYWLLEDPSWFVLTLFFTDAQGTQTVALAVPNLAELAGVPAWIQDYGVASGLEVLSSVPIGGVIR